MKVCIYGAGAIGGLVAARLAALVPAGLVRADPAPALGGS